MIVDVIRAMLLRFIRIDRQLLNSVDGVRYKLSIFFHFDLGLSVFRLLSCLHSLAVDHFCGGGHGADGRTPA